MKNQKYGWILIGLLMGMIIGALTLPAEAWGADMSRYVYIEPHGATIKEEVYPHGAQIKEAQEFLDGRMIVVPEDIKALCEKYGAENNICPELLEAVIFVESSFQSQVENNGCKGLMQIKPTAHAKRMKRLSVTDPYNQEQNIKVGADYLRELFETYGDPATVLEWYNGDSASANSEKVSAYAEKVLKISQALERAYYE